MKEADENYDPWKKKLRDLLAQIYLALLPWTYLSW